MARIRSIKPEFFTDEDVGSLPPLTRLLFIAMWCEADKAGRIKDKPASLKARCLPFDNIKVEKALEELADAQFIYRYEVDGERYIQVRTWEEHQRPHHTERESRMPPYGGNGYLTVTSPLENGEKKDSRNREPSSSFPSLPFLSFPKPPSLEMSERFKVSWESWVRHRQQIKKPLTEEQVKKQLAKFEEWGPDKSSEVIDHTVAQGWQGLREPDAASNGHRRPATNDPLDEWMKGKTDAK